MKGIKELNLNGDRIFLKKDILGWRVINPYKIDNQIVWKNILIGGSWIKFGALIFIVILMLLSAWEYNTAITLANECLNKSTFIYP